MTDQLPPLNLDDISDVVDDFRHCVNSAQEGHDTLAALDEAIEYGEFVLARLTSGDELGHMDHRIDMLEDTPDNAILPAKWDLVTWMGEQIDRLYPGERPVCEKCGHRTISTRRHVCGHCVTVDWS